MLSVPSQHNLECVNAYWKVICYTIVPHAYVRLLGHHHASLFVALRHRACAVSVLTLCPSLSAGCFWGPELAFQRVPGVISTEVGYTNGKVEAPTYEEVCTGNTGAAEVVQIMYDTAEVTFEQLLDVFWAKHDPTQLNRQGADQGTQYR